MPQWKQIYGHAIHQNDHPDKHYYEQKKKIKKNFYVTMVTMQKTAKSWRFWHFWWFLGSHAPMKAHIWSCNIPKWPSIHALLVCNFLNITALYRRHVFTIHLHNNCKMHFLNNLKEEETQCWSNHRSVNNHHNRNSIFFLNLSLEFSLTLGLKCMGE